MNNHKLVSIGAALLLSTGGLLLTGCENMVNITQGLVGYYPFAGTAEDASGNGNNGDARNGVDLSGGAAHFDGDDDVIVFPTTDAMFDASTPRQLSFSLRIKVEEAEDSSILNAYDSNDIDGDGQYPFDLTVNDDGDLSVQARYTDCSSPIAVNCHVDNELLIASSSNMQLGQWYWVAVVFDQDQETLTAYFNGQLAGSTALSPTHDYTDNDEIRLGLRIDVGQATAEYEGGVDELRFYDRALNAEEVATLHSM